MQIFAKLHKKYKVLWSFGQILCKSVIGKSASGFRGQNTQLHFLDAKFSETFNFMKQIFRTFGFRSQVFWNVWLQKLGIPASEAGCTLTCDCNSIRVNHIINSTSLSWPLYCYSCFHSIIWEVWQNLKFSQIKDCFSKFGVSFKVMPFKKVKT